MNNIITFVGLDVHKESINIALADSGDNREVRHFGTVNGTPTAVEKVVRKLISVGKTPRVVYEAGPTGFHLQRHLASKHIDCIVVSPSLIPTKPGDKVKTDKRDAMALARLHRAGELAPIYVPTDEDEAMRDLTRARVDAKIAHIRARQHLLSLLLRNGVYYTGKADWSNKHLRWLSKINLPHKAQQIVFQDYVNSIEQAHQRHEQLVEQIRIESSVWKRAPLVNALQALRGVSLITAAGIVSEIGDFTRFDHPRQLYAYVGLVPSEYSSGLSRRQGSITRCGNTHARRLLTESSWSYHWAPKVSPPIRKRQEDLPQVVCEIAWRAQVRLSRKYRKMIRNGKDSKLAVTAVARELIGFMWEIAKAL